MISFLNRLAVILLSLLSPLTTISQPPNGQSYRAFYNNPEHAGCEPVCNADVHYDHDWLSCFDDFSCVSDIQEKLKSNEALIEYHFTDSAFLVLCVSHESFVIGSHNLTPWFWIAMKAFRNKMKSADLGDYVSLGQAMYTVLISPLMDFLNGKNRLIIIPGVLTGIPFEAFISEVDSPKSNRPAHIRFLVADFEIIYNYSPAIWADLFEKRDKEPGRPSDQPEFAFAGFSPVFRDHPTLTPLPDSRLEIEKIDSMFVKHGMMSIIANDTESKESSFKKLAGNTRIIHLATHSITNRAVPEACGLLFWGYQLKPGCDSMQDGVLTGEEIMKLKLKADLIVLNTCGSGMGQVIAGRSTFPLTWHFLKAGAKNILSSLWNVTDYMAGQFMIGFYRNWLKGQTYSEALRKVKLDLIGNPQTSLPSIWAPYILVGQ